MTSVKRFIKVCTTLFLLPQLALSFTPSTFLGPSCPAPQSLSKNPTILAAHSKFDSLVQSALATGVTTHGPFDNTTTAFSFEFFSVTDSTPLYEYHYTPPFLFNASLGVKSVDGDTVYRIGSCTKLLTVYAFLIADGDIKFNEPITKYVPEILAASKDGKVDAVKRIAWGEVTIGALASHMAGLGPDCMSSIPSPS
jgi:Beta-lactamase